MSIYHVNRKNRKIVVGAKNIMIYQKCRKSRRKGFLMALYKTVDRIYINFLK